MNLQLESSVFLKLLFLLPIIWALSFLAFGRLPLWRMIVSSFLRSLVLALIILALAGLGRVDKLSSELSLIFSADVSDSISQENKAWMANYIKEVDARLPSNIKRGLVVFGSEAQVLSPPENRIKPQDFRWELDTTHTNIASGILSTLKLFPKDTVKRVVLLTDGNENLGNSRQTASIVEKEKIKIFTVEPPPPPTIKEVLVSKMLVPPEIKQNEAFEIRVVVENKNSQEVAGSLSLFEGERLLKKLDASLPPGLSVFDMPYEGSEKGLLEFHAQLEVNEANEDLNKENNHKQAFTNVTGKPKILYVRGDPNKKPFLVEAIQEKDIEVEVKGILDIPNSLQELLRYECLIFSNVPARALSHNQMETIKTYVGDFGGGFVMVGGEDSFAQGGYSDTPIEDILPVKVTAGSTFKEKKPRRVSIILLVDKSGSMTGRKLFATKRASIELLKQLKEGDMMGIIAFDVIPYVIAEMEPVTELEKTILSKLSKLNAGGGTDIFPALKEAYRRLAASGAKINHAILLSDGNTRSIYYSYEALMEQFKKAQISVSTIAVGGWLVNTRLMKDIADRTGGEFYRVKDIDELPKIVVTDTDNTLTRADFHEESFIPRIDPSSELLKGIDQEQVPPLQGYSLTRAKARAEVSLVSDIRGTNDPILANWRYGLGKVVAYTSDAEARWSSQWINWAKYNKFWSQTTRWAMRDKSKGDYTVKVEDRDNKTYLVVESSGEEEKDSQLRLRLFSSNLEANDLSLRQVAPKRYVASLEGYKPGTYTLDVSMLKDNNVIDHMTKPVVVPPPSTVAPPEGLSQGNNTELLEALAQLTHGEVNPTLESIARNTEEVMKREDLSKFLIPLAMGLLLFDIAVRRVGLL
jgi:uncharacterized membrane protein